MVASTARVDADILARARVALTCLAHGVATADGAMIVQRLATDPTPARGLVDSKPAAQVSCDARTYRQDSGVPR